MIINNYSTTIYQLDNNKYEIRSNDKNLTLINPLNISLSLTNQNNNLIFENNSGKNIYNFVLIDNNQKIYSRPIINNNQIININLNDITENDLTIKYNFYKNNQLNTIYIFNIYNNPIIQ